MTTRQVTVVRTVLIALCTAVIVLTPFGDATAQTSIHRGQGSLDADESGKLVRPRGYARSNYVWPYAVGPHFVVDGAEPGLLWAQAGVFRVQDAAVLPTELRTPYRLDQQPAQHFAVQVYEGASGDELRATIEGHGGRLLDAAGDTTIVALLNHAAYKALSTMADVVAIEPYHAAYKLDAGIGRVPLPDPIKALSEVYTLEVVLWDGEDAEAAAAAARAAGADVKQVFGDSLLVEMNRSLLAGLAQIEAVKAVIEQLPNLLHAEETTTVMQTGNYNHGAIPYHDAGVTGSGLNKCINNKNISCTVANQAADCAGAGGICLGPQVLMVLDSGIQLDAGDLSNTRTDGGSPSLTHRKVRVHQTTNGFGGTGDLNGCDAPAQGGFTHGHVVSAGALGNATAVNTATYGAGWIALDLQGNPWKLDGVAPKAVVVAYDGQITPPNGSCSDPLLDSILPGDLYATPSSGSLGASYTTHGARITNFSWGSIGNAYTAGSADIDAFMFDKGDALVFVSAGNNGDDVLPEPGDGIPDTLTLGAPATTKNGFAIGASRNANTVNSPESRAFFSSTGPAVSTSVNRIAPQLMAPGDEPGIGALGLSSEFSCRSNDNNQTNPVMCDIITGAEGTSFAAPAAAGAALLVRDYFAQGYHPKAKQIPNDSRLVGAALTKAVLIASADFMTGANLTRGWRFNNEQGYGRIQLDNVLPLENWPASPTGLLIHDPFSSTTNLNLPFNVSSNQVAQNTFVVVNDDEELRVALAWIDQGSQTLVRDINLTLISPSGIQYRGNYFTDDNDQDGVPEVAEDCGGIGSADPNVSNSQIDQGQWSLPVCNLTGIQGRNLQVAPFDNANVTEAIFLSNDPEGDDEAEGGNPGTGGNEGLCDPTATANANGPCNNNLDCRASVPGNFGDGECINPDDYQQTELGTWTIRVAATNFLVGGVQPFAVAVAGGVSLGSTVRFDEGSYTCNQRARVTVTEVLDSGVGGTDNPTETVVEGRVTVQVLDSNDVVVDSETGLNFTKDPAALKFDSDEIQITDSTARDPGNHVLDVRTGDSLRVLYNDVDVDVVGLPVLQRTNTATITCRVDVGFGDITFAQYGQDSSVLVQGGCERNLRGRFEFGFPDRYMDADEPIFLNFAFRSNELEDMENVQASMRCVNVDTDSPAKCLPSGAGCLPSECGGDCDPLRLNNTACQWMTILGSPKSLGFIPAGAAMAANYAIVMANEATFGGQTPTVELVLELTASTSGKTQSGVAVARQRLNVDTVSTMYSTDYPGGGTSEVLDEGPGQKGNNDEIASNPITELAGLQANDYRFETMTFGSLTATGKNLNLLSPWNFDGNDGGFRHGLAGPTTEDAANIFAIANWGEDKNFNNIEDGRCSLDQSIACFTFGADPRCTGAGTCNSQENNAGGSSFTKNWNTKGGCGWQTRATGDCTGDATRGCFTNSDCLGTCRVLNNDVASTFTPCSTTPQCPSALACENSASVPNPLKGNPCTTAADCGGVANTCDPVAQQCLGAAGTCGAVVGDHTGGVWHTGAIDNQNVGTCGAAGSSCVNYRAIPGTGGDLLWWELLTTPVLEKVNQAVNPDGTPQATIEIFDMAWNSNVNARERHAAWSWEIDTDLTTLDPVDLYADTFILGLGNGPYGAVQTGSNPALTRGWPIFAPQCACSTAPNGPCTSLFQCSPGTCTVSGKTCHVAADCAPGHCTVSGADCFADSDCDVGQTCTNPAPEGCVGGPTCNCTGGSINGNAGGNRRGDAGCFFEGKIAAVTFPDLGLAGPPDDDRNNDLRTCALNDAEGMPVTCIQNSDCADLGLGNCNLTGDVTVDEFVQDDGPYRNHDVVAFNGPDMRFATLEDIYGDTGNTFQAAIGFINFEGTPNAGAGQSYGVAVDDLVLKWREYTFIPDATSCTANFSCAVLELDTSNVFEGQAVIGITVLEKTPDAVNDCDLDGAPDGTNDCNGNAIPDVVVRSVTNAELSGEISFLDRVSPTGTEYKGAVVVSSSGDSPGTLYISQAGADVPVVTVTYNDKDINPGAPVEPCPNDVDPTKFGLVQGFQTVFLGTTCSVQIVRAETIDNGDKDVYADTEETVNMRICVINNCGADLHNCSGRIFSNSPEVDCIVQSVADFGDLQDLPQIICGPYDFKWKVANVNRTSVSQALNAEFTMSMTCDEIDALSTIQEASVPLDLDIDSGGQSPVPWTEGFEAGNLAATKFFAENLDAGIPGANNTEGLLNGNGWRCQYSDPDWPNSNPFGDDEALWCYPGATLAQSNNVFWKVDGIDTGSPNGGRARTGNYSGYYGQYLTTPAGAFTTPTATVESIATTAPINLGVPGPELTWYHQVSLIDGRGLNMPYVPPNLRSAGRGVIQVKTVDNAGNDTSDWSNLQPYKNSYDTQAYDNYFNCYFDPVDDGTTEDDFFDPTDPDRRLGPSSSCYPEFNWSCQGDTNDPFQAENLCNAASGPGVQGSLGPGTWVESRVDLSGLAGRRIKLRFIANEVKGGTFETYDAWFPNINSGGNAEVDNGWWIDDLNINQTFTNPATFTADADVVHHCTGNTSIGCLTNADCTAAGTTGPCTGAAPQCGPTCTTVTANVVTTPNANGGAGAEAMSAPGQAIELDASGSSGTCLDGTLQYQFRKNGSIVRLYTENPIYIDVPQSTGTTIYQTDVRCSTAQTCLGSATVNVTVNCPGGGNAPNPFFTDPIRATNKTTWAWTGATSFDLRQGTLNNPAGVLPIFPPAYTGSTTTPAPGTSFVDATVPPANTGRWYLVKFTGVPCNAAGWSGCADQRDDDEGTAPSCEDSQNGAAGTCQGNASIGCLTAGDCTASGTTGPCNGVSGRSLLP
jgi:hypothetical protein